MWMRVSGTGSFLNLNHVARVQFATERREKRGEHDHELEVQLVARLDVPGMVERLVCVGQDAVDLKTELMFLDRFDKDVDERVSRQNECGMEDRPAIVEG